MAFDLTTVTGGGSPALSSGSAKFGPRGLSGGGYGFLASAGQAAQPDAFLLNGTITNDTNGAGAMGTGTIECWVKRASNPASTEIFLGHDHWYWIGCGTDGKPTLHYGGGGTFEKTITSSGSSICDGNFHHVAIDFNAGKPTMYVDGVSVATSTTTQACGTAVTTGSAPGFGIGTFSSNSSFNWGGSIDEVCLSSTRQYTTGFTPSTSAFASNRSGAVAIYHLDLDAFNCLNTTAVLPDDANILYSPFNWDVSNARAKTINPGAYLRMLVDGATPTRLVFDMTGILTPTPQIAYRIDDGPWTAATIAASVTLTAPSTNQWTKHTIEIAFKAATETQARWSTQATALALMGVVCGTAGATTVAVQRRGLNLLVFGDSITEGIRTLGSTQTNDTDRNDGRFSFAYLLGDMLGAEVGVVGFGGSGISVTGSGSVPVLGTSYSLLWGSGPSRSFSTVVPDAILLQEGTNDSTTDITTDYTTVLNALLAATPSTTVIVCLRPFNGTSQAAHIQAAIAACTAPSRCLYVDTAGWLASGDTSDSTHPYGYINVESLSQQVAAKVRAAFAARGPMFRNVAGVATTLTPYRG